MIIDIPFHYAASVALRGRDGTFQAVMPGRESLMLASFGPDEAPVSVRWRPVAGGPWSHIREVEGRHAVPLWGDGLPSSSARPLLARLLRDGWDGVGAEVAPTGEHMDIDDYRIGRLLDDDKGRRVESLRRRAASLSLVDGVPHAFCDEPLLVETGNGIELRLGGSHDWSRVHPLSEPEAALASARRTGNDDAFLHHYEVLRPGGLRIDRPHILGKVVRKALILVRRTCESDAAARADADAAEAALGVGSNLAAASAMDRCLEVLSRGSATAQGVRDYAQRTRTYLAEHLVRPRALAAA